MGPLQLMFGLWATSDYFSAGATTNFTNAGLGSEGQGPATLYSVMADCSSNSRISRIRVLSARRLRKIDIIPSSAGGSAIYVPRSKGSFFSPFPVLKSIAPSYICGELFPRCCFFEKLFW